MLLCISWSNTCELADSEASASSKEACVPAAVVADAATETGCRRDCVEEEGASGEAGATADCGDM